MNDRQLRRVIGGRIALSRGQVAKYGTAALSTGMVAAWVEIHPPALGHGTHLLVVLTVAIGIVLVLGPRPGSVGLAAGGTTSAVASFIGLGPEAPVLVTLLQLVLYVFAGAAFIAVVSVTRRPVSPPKVAGRPWGLGAGPLEPLTDREVEVLRLAASGLAVGTIADALFVSRNTVKTHLSRAYGKLGAHNRADAVRAALHCGCLSPHDICPHLNAHELADRNHPNG